jgi:MoxR-like ATPase
LSTTAGVTPPGVASSSDRNCNNCPAQLKPGAQAATLGANTGGPVCGIKLLPLVSPKQGSKLGERVMSDIAEKCEKFGTKVDSFRNSPTTDVLPLQVGLATAEPTPDAYQSGARCTSCVNFVPAPVVSEKTGWTTGLCKATGYLMPDNRQSANARSCGKYARRSPAHRADLTDFMFFPQYSEKYGQVDERKKFALALDNFVAPDKFENERPLTPGLADLMLRRGIRAWREIKDPHGYGEPVYLPIFDANAKVPVLDKDGKSTGEFKELFTDLDRELIPRAGQPERPEFYADHGQLLYRQAVLWMKLDETPAWWGQGGVGKTEFARHLAFLMGLPFRRLNITGSTELDDLVGKLLFEGGETVFHYGRLPVAWRNPGILLLDEPNTGPADVWQVIRPLTDNSRLLVVDVNKGERITRHADCYFALAMNPAWDPRNVGTQTLGDADGSRLMHMAFTLPPPELEMEILRRRAKLDGYDVPEDLLRHAMAVAQEIRQLSDDGTLHTTWGLRHQIKLVRAFRWFDPMSAYRIAAGDAMEPSQFEALLTIIKAHFGG